MRVVFDGAADEVTGSCHLVEAGGLRLLLDCGLIQGSAADERRNGAPFPFDPAAIDAVILSHAHIDHSGRIPLLVKRGFRGTIHTHEATLDLVRVMLRDSAYLSEKEAEWENRKRRRKHLPEVAPLYTGADVETCLERFRGTAYGVWHDLGNSVAFRLQDAGHILGSAIVEVTDGRRRIAFSGDLGLRDAPVLRDVSTLTEADLVLLESTYGDRLHRPRQETCRELGEILRDASAGRGNVLIPAFAVGRTQELLYLFREHYRDWGLDRWRVFLDSPMAIEATEVYLRHSRLFDEPTRALWAGRRPDALLPNLHLCRSAEDSMGLNRIRSGAIIIAGSGMCTGGRIKHHLKHHAWRRGCHLLFVGFQARGTLGRRIVDGHRHISLWGESIRLGAAVHTVGGLSAHADRAGLLDWYGAFRGRPPVALVHGEPGARRSLAQALAGELGVRAALPVRDEALTVDRPAATGAGRDAG